MQEPKRLWISSDCGLKIGRFSCLIKSIWEYNADLDRVTQDMESEVYDVSPQLWAETFSLGDSIAICKPKKRSAWPTGSRSFQRLNELFRHICHLFTTVVTPCIDGFLVIFHKTNPPARSLSLPCRIDRESSGFSAVLVTGLTVFSQLGGLLPSHWHCKRCRGTVHPKTPNISVYIWNVARTKHWFCRLELLSRTVESRSLSFNIASDV